MAQQLSIDSIVTRSKDIPFSQLDDELLAIDAEAGYCYSLNEPAGRIWELIASPVAIQAICDQLGKEYAVDPETCAREVLTLLQGLSDASLVQLG